MLTGLAVLTGLTVCIPLAAVILLRRACALVRERGCGRAERQRERGGGDAGSREHASYCLGVVLGLHHGPPPRLEPR